MTLNPGESEIKRAALWRLVRNPEGEISGVPQVVGPRHTQAAQELQEP
jgi:hypothetical protein